MDGVLSGSHWSAGNREHKSWRAAFSGRVGGTGFGVLWKGGHQFILSITASFHAER